MLASPGIVGIDGADGGVGVAVGVEVGSGVGVGIGVGVAVGVEVGSGVGVATGFTDRLQLTVRKPIRRSKDAQKQPLRFRSMVKNPFKTPYTLARLSLLRRIKCFFLSFIARRWA